MPVTFGELSSLTTPLSIARFWALLWGCLTLSLAATVETNKEFCMSVFHKFCMTSWCSFFILTFFIVAINFIQFHSLLPLSWKNLTATVSALGMLMVVAATFAYPWTLEKDELNWKPVVVTVSSFLTSLGYLMELQLIRRQDGQQQRGYMASIPGLLKVLQVFGGCVALVLLVAQKDNVPWRVSILAVAYILCLVTSLGTVLVMVADCAGRCPVPFNRLLAGFSVMGLLFYMVTTVICITTVLGPHNECVASMSEAVIVGITLLAYTVDLAFSVKLLCYRS